MKIEYINYISACLAPTIAILGIFITICQYNLSLTKRKDDLFDRRYAFYQKIRDKWLSTFDDREMDCEELIPYAEEAEFIFGSDISKHILSLSDKNHNGSPFFPEEDFIKPFRKYLKIR